ncbi:DASH complex subunit DAM1 [Aspergillus tanneri]|uniref:DASH complex subunit DAM1 n=1 Tax=Aspergillus tanneri TaxID=1220188 RepID=A0A5M9MRP2_9EURO|nr:DASH complex subunit dam1 [Aspergillus tanneri]KAA8649772.1 DASH complex subunit dam1 [Aspergillus tanneri]
MDATAPLSRSSSRPRPSSRPTTPLRPSSRSSFREGHGYGASVSNTGYTDPAINALEPQFAELADSMADLEANFMHLQLMHESLTRFSESFASFLYGLNMNAFCVDFPEAPIPESFRRAKQAEVERELETEQNRPIHEDEATFMTTDTTFIEHPPSTTSSKPTPKSSSVPSRGTRRGSNPSFRCPSGRSENAATRAAKVGSARQRIQQRNTTASLSIDDSLTLSAYWTPPLMPDWETECIMLV